MRPHVVVVVVVASCVVVGRVVTGVCCVCSLWQEGRVKTILQRVLSHFLVLCCAGIFYNILLIDFCSAQTFSFILFRDFRMFIMDYVAFSLGFIILLLSFSSQSVPASHIVLLHTKAAATSQTLKLTSKCYLFELNILISKST